MFWILLCMLLILVAAAAVVVYVAFPHRGEQVPVAPWVGEAMKRGVAAMPTLDPETKSGGNAATEGELAGAEDSLSGGRTRA